MQNYPACKKLNTSPGSKTYLPYSNFMTKYDKELTLKVPITTPADDILKYLF